MHALLGPNPSTGSWFDTRQMVAKPAPEANLAGFVTGEGESGVAERACFRRDKASGKLPVLFKSKHRAGPGPGIEYGLDGAGTTRE